MVVVDVCGGGDIYIRMKPTLTLEQLAVYTAFVRPKIEYGNRATGAQSRPTCSSLTKSSSRQYTQVAWD